MGVLYAPTGGADTQHTVNDCVNLTIYLLTFRGEVYYVGSTGRYPERIEEHLVRMREGRHPNRRVQAAYATYGVPVATILEVARVSTPQEAAAAEDRHILHYFEAHPHNTCNQALADPRGFEYYFPIPDEDLNWSKKKL
jgi:predicted GIY-YIG superfamily endonuclease